jgi:hypothetical protein
MIENTRLFGPLTDETAPQSYRSRKTSDMPWFGVMCIRSGHSQLATSRKAESSIFLGVEVRHATFKTHDCAQIFRQIPQSVTLEA